MPSTRWFALPCLAVALLVAGCDLFVQPQTVLVGLDAPTPEQAETTRALLLERLAGRQPHPLATLRATVEGDQVRLEFEHGAPPAADIEYLAGTRGQLRVGRLDDRPFWWFHDKSIVSASPFVDNGQPTVMIKVDARTAKHLFEYTSENLNTPMQMTLDGKSLQVANIRTPFGEGFVTTFDSAAQARLIARVLDSGPLPVDVTYVRRVETTR